MKNQLIHADNLITMSHINSQSIDLIYVDPPFASQANYHTKDGTLAFSDKDDITTYLIKLKIRLIRMHDLLTNNGSIYVHVDWRVSHHVRFLLDDIFGQANLLNEIIWAYNSGGGTKTRFGRKHDTILLYSKTKQYTFNTDIMRVPYSKDINIPASKAHYYHPIGKVLSDVWQIPTISQNNKCERVDYPTQKPEALLRRIILASSNPGDTVADFYCGSGTTCVVARQLNRNWIGIDSSKIAIEIASKRLANCS
jgi:DNA modification methylase